MSRCGGRVGDNASHRCNCNQQESDSFHFLIRVIRGRVFYHRDLEAELSGKANSCLSARVCYEPDDDEFVDAMRFEQPIQIGVAKAAGTPMLEGYDIARLRFEFRADLATPRAVFEGLPSLSVVLTDGVLQESEWVAGELGGKRSRTRGT
jgi:hypothetical protein